VDEVSDEAEHPTARLDLTELGHKGAFLRVEVTQLRMSHIQLLFTARPHRRHGLLHLFRFFLCHDHDPRISIDDHHVTVVFIVVLWKQRVFLSQGGKSVFNAQRQADRGVQRSKLLVAEGSHQKVLVVVFDLILCLQFGQTDIREREHLVARFGLDKSHQKH